MRKSRPQWILLDPLLTDRVQTCNLEMSVDIDDADRQAIESLQDISIICSKNTNPYLKAGKTGKPQVVACDELAAYIWTNSKQPVELHNRPAEVTVTQ